MNQKKWQKIESIVDEALQIEQKENRESYIKKACQSKEQLYRQVKKLLISIQKAEETYYLEQK